MMDLDQKANSPKWKYIYQSTWTIGVVALVIYTYFSWPTQYNYVHPDEYYVQFLIYGIYYLGMAGARWRYYQYQTLRMYLLTLAASLFIGVMTLTELLGRLASTFFGIAVWMFCISMAIIILAPHEHV